MRSLFLLFTLSVFIIQATESEGDSPAKKKKNAAENLGFGIQNIGSDNPKTSEKAFRMLERIILKPEEFDRELPKNVQYFVVANMCGRWRWERTEHEISMKLLGKALEAKPNDVCTFLQLATSLNPFPRTIQDADASYSAYHSRMDTLLRIPADHHLDPIIAEIVPGAEFDVFDHCVNTLFFHSFYYRGDPRSATSKFFQVMTRFFPEFEYERPGLPPPPTHVKKSNRNKPIVNRRIRLGVASGFLLEDSSVSEDFKGVLQHLDRDIFEITYFLFLGKHVNPEHIPPYVTKEKHVIFHKTSPGYHEWLVDARQRVVDANLDILYFLDLTMSTHAHRFAMGRLAPVQAVSHGHPMTSGIPSRIMNYYISWAAAELPLSVAQEHYTEKLKLLPANKMHQYYENRIENGKSAMSDGLAFQPLVDAGRSEIFPEVPADGNWYLCMQKPFKLHPEFDMLVSKILQADPKGRVVLHRAESSLTHKIFMDRLTNVGCDMKRVHFLSVQPRFRLFALYSLSDVILDSFPAGGCTTTREVLEIGKVVVTLPARFLGGRWSLALYNVLEDDTLTSRAVAKDSDDYVQKAVALGTNTEFRQETEELVTASVHKLFRRKDAIEAWTDMFLEIAPVMPASVSNVPTTEL